MGFYTAEEFRHLTFPDTSLVGDGLLHEKSKLLLAGETGLGKSYIILQMARDLAEGRAWFGQWAVKRPLKVLYLQVEIAEGLLWRRCERLYGEKVPANLALWTPDEDEAVTEESYWPVIADRAADFDVIIFDPLYMIVEGDENQVHTVRPAQKRFDALRRAGHALIVVHHTRKVSGVPQPMSVDMIRGSSAWPGWADTVMLASSAKAEQVRLTVLKARNREAGAPKPLLLNWQKPGDFLTVSAFADDDPLTYVYAAVEELKEAASKAALAKFLQGEYGMSKATAYRALDKAVSTGLVEVTGKGMFLPVIHEES